VRQYLFDIHYCTRASKLAELRGQLRQALDAVTTGWGSIKAAAQVDDVAFLGSSLEGCSAIAAAKRISRTLSTPQQLAVWTTWLIARQDCQDAGLTGLIDAFAGEELESIRLSDALDRVYWRTMVRSAMAEHPGLGRFRGVQLDKARERFARLDEEIIQLQRKALAAELCRRPIDQGYKADYRKDDTGLELVHHEIGKKKRHIPIRELLDRPAAPFSK
jgi:hypothetical protein